MITTQDLIKGVDFTQFSIAQASHYNQLVDFGRLGPDRGLILTSTDEAEDDPEVPNPAAAYEDSGTAITPVWFKDYLWRRIKFDGTVVLYVWQDSLETADAVLLKWVVYGSAGAEALAAVDEAVLKADQATIDAGDAVVQAANALEQVVDAQDTADEAKTIATAASEKIDLYETRAFKAGDIKTTLSSRSYSTTEDEGWLVCDGSSVSKTRFENLWDAIGYTYGGTGDSFNVPDARGKAIICDGDGPSLTPRSLGQTVGQETLTIEEQYLPKHQHYLYNNTQTYGQSDANSTLAGFSRNTSDQLPLSLDNYRFQTQPDPITRPANFGLSSAFGQEDPTPVNLMQPSLVGRLLIKT